jgi:hypothetical protein
MVENSDERFHGIDAPKFRSKLRAKAAEVSHDDRFSSTKQPRFSSDELKRSKIDQYGRPVKKRRTEPADADSTKHVAASDNNKARRADVVESRLEYLNRLARGEISGESSSDSSDYDAESDAGSDEDERDATAIESQDDRPSLISQYYNASDSKEEFAPSTRRLALQNFDWQNLRATDILYACKFAMYLELGPYQAFCLSRVTLQSFCPSGGSVKSVIVYQSDFGKEQMEKEQQLGPQGIWAKDRTSSKRTSLHSDKGNNDKDDQSDVDSVDDEVDENWGDFQREDEIGIVYADGSEEGDEVGGKEADSKLEGIDPIKLREYELNKLRYYFAIAEFDSIRTAESIYKELDGVEFEHSSMVFDLRFVPDDVRYYSAPSLLILTALMRILCCIVSMEEKFVTVLRMCRRSMSRLPSSSTRYSIPMSNAVGMQAIPSASAS